MQKQLYIIGLAVIGLAAIWMFTGNEEQVLPADPAAEPTPVQSTTAEAIDAPESDGAADTESTSSISPFSVLQEPDATATASTNAGEADQLTTNPDGANTVETVVDPPTDTGNAVQAGTATNEQQVIVVPSSYPASDAAKYFVPADQRRPGNLGGPPPLPFSDSTAGPTLPGDGGLSPPAAPGE